MRLGVTGGIGSGKTSVCRVFKILGVPVFSADIEARKIMETNKGVIETINSITGSDMYANGSLKRAELAKLIFNDEDLLQKVNLAVHPLVIENFTLWEKLQNAPYVIMEAAILFESGANNLVDRILTVTAPFEERIERVMKRNNLTREQVMERIKIQTSDDEKIKQSHYVIDNSDHSMIIAAILKVHEDLLKIKNR